MNNLVSYLRLLSLTAILGLAIAIAAQGENAATSKTSASFEGVVSARIDKTGGMPRLVINNKPVLPILLMPNTDVSDQESDRNLAEQVKLASGVGVHLYTLPLSPADAQRWW